MKTNQQTPSLLITICKITSGEATKEEHSWFCEEVRETLSGKINVNDDYRVELLSLCINFKGILSLDHEWLEKVESDFREGLYLKRNSWIFSPEKIEHFRKKFPFSPNTIALIDALTKKKQKSIDSIITSSSASISTPILI